MAADGHPDPEPLKAAAPPAARGPAPASVREELRRRNWEALGLERTGAALADHLAYLTDLRAHVPPLPGDRVAAEDRNLIDVSWTMAVSALFREESRGGHFRLDHPHADDRRFLGHTRLEGETPRLVEVEMNATAAAR